MIQINDMEMPKRCAECKICVAQKTNDYGTYGKCLLQDKSVNCLVWSRDTNCLLVESEDDMGIFDDGFSVELELKDPSDAESWKRVDFIKVEVLDKIRAEIWDLQYGDEEKSETDENMADAYNNAIRQVIEIIDNHMVESEGKI